MNQLRPYQLRLRDQREQAHAEGARAVLIQAPTGSGKTVSFAESAGAETGRVLILAHRRELIKQALDKLAAAGVPCSPYPSATPARVQVGSVQTLSRRNLPPYARIIVDEAHHAVAPGYRKILDDQPDALIDGYTATPERLDGRGLGRVAGGPFDDLIIGPSVRELIADGFLVSPRSFGAERGPDLAQVRTMAGEYSTVDLARAMSKPVLTGDAVAHYEQLAPGAPGVAFCVTVDHARETAAAFRAEGWRAVAVYGDMPEEERDAAFKGLAAGRIHILTSCSLIDEGLDIPDIRCVIDLAPTKSLGRFMQRGGRGLRPAPGKRDMIHLDHAGNTFRHGLLTADRVWTLAGARRTGSEAPRVVQCPVCYALHSPAPECPACGHSYADAERAAARRELEQEKGRLTEMTEEDMRLQHLRTAPLRELVKGANMIELEEIGTARGYHPGWAETTMKFKRQARAKA